MFSGELKFQPPIGGVYLRDVLQQKAKAMRAGIEQSVPMVVGKIADEGAYVDQMVGSYSVAIPHVDVEFEHIKKTERYNQVHGSQLMEGDYIPDRLYRVWIVTFGIPYEGDIELVQYVPRTGGDFGWRPHLTVRDGCVWFETQTLDDGPETKKQAIADQKQRAITFLQQYIDGVTPELEEFNQGVARGVLPLFEAEKQKYQRDRDILAQL